MQYLFDQVHTAYRKQSTNENSSVLYPRYAALNKLNTHTQLFTILRYIILDFLVESTKDIFDSFDYPKSDKSLIYFDRASNNLIYCPNNFDQPLAAGTCSEIMKEFSTLTYCMFYTCIPERGSKSKERLAIAQESDKKIKWYYKFNDDSAYYAESVVPKIVSQAISLINKLNNLTDRAAIQSE